MGLHGTTSWQVSWLRIKLAVMGTACVPQGVLANRRKNTVLLANRCFLCLIFVFFMCTSGRHCCCTKISLHSCLLAAYHVLCDGRCPQARQLWLQTCGMSQTETSTDLLPRCCRSGVVLLLMAVLTLLMMHWQTGMQ